MKSLKKDLGQTIGCLSAPEPNVLSLACEERKTLCPGCIWINKDIFWTFDSFFYRYMPVVSKWVSSWRTQETWRKSESVKKKKRKYKFWLKHYCGIFLKSFSVFLLQLFIHLNSAKFQPHSAQDYFPYKKVFARN